MKTANKCKSANFKEKWYEDSNIQKINSFILDTEPVIVMVSHKVYYPVAVLLFKAIAIYVRFLRRHGNFCTILPLESGNHLNLK